MSIKPAKLSSTQLVEPPEYKKRLDSLHATYFTSKDLEEGTSGAGNSSCGINPLVYQALEAIHKGSVSLEAPLAYSFVSSTKMKRGNIAAVKVVGKGDKVKTAWDCHTNNALTARQQRLQQDAARAELTTQLQRETLEMLKDLRKAREEREAKAREEKK